MFAFPGFGHRFPARTLILASALTAVFRWACMALQPGIEWLIPLQCLNAITFALGYLGRLHDLHRQLDLRRDRGAGPGLFPDARSRP